MSHAGVRHSLEFSDATELVIRLRAHAFANDALLAAVASDVVNRRVRFEP